MSAQLICGESLEQLVAMAAESIDALVTDPPAGISFMGKTWDAPGSYGYSDGADRAGAPPTVNLARNPTCQGCGGRKRAGAATRGCECDHPAFNDVELRLRDRIAFIGAMTAIFSACLRVLKPGAHGLVWALPRTSHWTATALEDAGFEVRDVVIHLFGSGFPKSKNVEDIGTALKPACEHWILVRKPLIGTVAVNVQKHGTGGMNIDACRIDGPAGRWPANVTLDEAAAALLDEQTGTLTSGSNTIKRASAAGSTSQSIGTESRAEGTPMIFYGDSGGASRFFYCAKASKKDKTAGGTVENTHPTVKSTELMRWLCKLITPPRGTILDCFAGSGSTGVAALAEGFRFIGIERSEEYAAIARARIKGDSPLFNLVAP